MTATITNEIAVEYCERPDVNRAFLKIQVPNGWDDVLKIKEKVLEYNGRKFAFTGWNSDTNQCYFARPLNGDAQTARIVKGERRVR
jgi:hypothetical protein